MGLSVGFAHQPINHSYIENNLSILDPNTAGNRMLQVVLMKIVHLEKQRNVLEIILTKFNNFEYMGRDQDILLILMTHGITVWTNEERWPNQEMITPFSTAWLVDLCRIASDKHANDLLERIAFVKTMCAAWAELSLEFPDNLAPLEAFATRTIDLYERVDNLNDLIGLISKDLAA